MELGRRLWISQFSISLLVIFRCLSLLELKVSNQMIQMVLGSFMSLLTHLVRGKKKHLQKMPPAVGPFALITPSWFSIKMEEPLGGPPNHLHSQGWNAGTHLVGDPSRGGGVLSNLVALWSYLYFPNMNFPPTIFQDLKFKGGGSHSCSWVALQSRNHALHITCATPSFYHKTL